MTMKVFVISIIKLYKLVLSPILGNNCRFNPTCSSYAIACIETYGLIRGIRIAWEQIIKCHPWNT